MDYFTKIKKSWQENRTMRFLLPADMLIVFLAWGGFVREGFAADTLFQRMLPMSNIGGDLDHGRYGMYFLAKTLFEHGFLITDHYHLFYALFLLSITINILLVQRLFLPFFKDKKESGSATFLMGFAACTALPFANVLFSEKFMFSEYLVNYAIAYFLGVLGTCLLARRKRLGGFICVIAACLFYQMAVIVTAMLLSAYFVFENDFRTDRKLIAREIIYNGLILFIGFLDNRSSYVLADLGVIRPEDVGKAISPHWRDTLRYLAEQTMQLMKSSLQLLPSVWVPGITAVVTCAVLLVTLVRRQEKKRAITILLLILAELLLFYTLPGLAGEGSFYPRMTFTWYLLQSILILTTLLFADNEWSRQLMTGLCISYLALQMLFCQFIAANRTLSNQLDILYAQSVLHEIGKYEERTGIKVVNIATVKDTDAPNSYASVKWKRDQVGERVLSISPFILLEHVNGDEQITYKHVEMDNTIYREYFEMKNWDVFDPSEQLIFVDDTLYWAIF